MERECDMKWSQPGLWLYFVFNFMLIIVSGLPGSGKSYFASRLAARLDAEYINSDKTRMAMNRMGRYSVEDKWLVYDRMAELAAGFLDLGKDVVLDGTFYLRTFRERFAELARRRNTDIQYIEVIADDAIVRQRLSRPRKYSEADYKVHEVIRNLFEPFDQPHLVLSQGMIQRK